MKRGVYMLRNISTRYMLFNEHEISERYRDVGACQFCGRVSWIQTHVKDNVVDDYYNLTRRYWNSELLSTMLDSSNRPKQVFCCRMLSTRHVGVSLKKSHSARQRRSTGTEGYKEWYCWSFLQPTAGVLGLEKHSQPCGIGQIAPRKWCIGISCNDEIKR